MRRGWVLWLAVFAVYAAAVVVLDASDPAPQVPNLLERLRETTSLTFAELVLAACAALTFALSAALARLWIPDPWATRGVLLVALSPLGFALSAGLRPGAPAGALLTGGLLLTLRAREHPTWRRTLGGAAWLALAPWFGLPYAAPAVPVGLALIYWTYRRGRPLLALLALEIGGASAVALASVPQPAARDAVPGDGPLRILALLTDRGVGVLRWAPVLVLAFVGAYLVARSRRAHLSRAIPARRDAEVATLLTGMAIVAMAGASAFGEVSSGAGLGLAAALGAWGLQRLPRVGAVLGLLTVVATVWVAVTLVGGDATSWLDGGSRASWGPATDIFPRY